MSSLETYVAEITTYLRRTKPHSTSLAVSAAELGIATEPQPTRNRGQGHRDGARPTPTCICGKEHWYADCFILNTRHPRRPRNYQPAADITRKVEEARRDPRINAAIKTALERFAARQPQSARTLRIDDGKPPANTDTFVILTGPSLMIKGHDSHDDRDGHEHYKDRDNRDDRDDRDNCNHDVHDVHVDHNLYNDHEDHEDRDDRDDQDSGVITIDSRTEPEEVLTVLAIEDTN
jgi:hypothetical protein